MTRARLPARRASTVLDFEHRGLRFTCSFSHDSDGPVAEVFLQNHKNDSGADVVCRDGGVITSLALQSRAQDRAARQTGVVRAQRRREGSSEGELRLDVWRRDHRGPPHIAYALTPKQLANTA
jgi:hypothetical protein